MDDLDSLSISELESLLPSVDSSDVDTFSEVLLLIAEQYFDEGNSSVAQSWYKKLNAFLIDNPVLKMEPECLLIMGKCYASQGDYQSASDIWERAYKGFAEEANDLGLVHVEMSICSVLALLERPDEIIQHASQALSICKIIEAYFEAGWLCREMAIQYVNKNYNQVNDLTGRYLVDAQEYAQLGVGYFENCGEQIEVSHMYWTLANIAHRSGEQQVALDWVSSATMSLNELPKSKKENSARLADCYILSGEILNSQRKYAEAFEVLKSSINILQHLDDAGKSLGTAYMYLAWVCNNLKAYEKTSNYAEKAIEVFAAKENGFEELLFKWRACIINSLNAKAYSYLQLGKNSESLNLCNEMISSLKEIYGNHTSSMMISEVYITAMLNNRDLLSWQTILDLAVEVQSYENFLPSQGQAERIDQLTALALSKIVHKEIAGEVLDYTIEGDPSHGFSAVEKITKGPIGFTNIKGPHFSDRKTQHASGFSRVEAESESRITAEESESAGNGAKVKGRKKQ